MNLLAPKASMAKVAHQNVANVEIMKFVIQFKAVVLKDKTSVALLVC